MRKTYRKAFAILQLSTPVKMNAFEIVRVMYPFVKVYRLLRRRKVKKRK